MPSNYRDEYGQDPFADESGKNPYGDDDTAPTDESQLTAGGTDNPYATAADARAGEYGHQPGDFETTLPPRGGLVLGLGMAALFLSFGAVYLTFAYGAADAAILVLAISLPPWIMGRMDLRAMRMGAMPAAGHRSQTRLGLWLGVIATAIALGCFANFLYLVLDHFVF